MEEQRYDLTVFFWKFGLIFRSLGRNIDFHSFRFGFLLLLLGKNHLRSPRSGMVEQATGVKMPVHIGFGYISTNFHDEPLGISFNVDSSFLSNRSN